MSQSTHQLQESSPERGSEEPRAGETHGEKPWADSAFDPERGTWRDLWREVRGECGVALAAYALLLVFCHFIGYRMVVAYWYLHLIDPELLRERFWESMLYLHMQPPLLNAALGGALHLAEAIGARVEALILAAHIILGAIMVVAWALTGGILIRNRTRRRVLLAVLVGHPVVYLTLFDYFYTFHELVFLALAPLPVWSFARFGRVASFAAVCLILTLLALERTLFHPVWVLSVPALLWLATRRLQNRLAGISATSADAAPAEKKDGSRRWKLAVCLGLMAAVVLSWGVKNYIVFGKFTYSTWQGYNVSKSLGIEFAPVAELPLEPPPPELDVPALAQVTKHDPERRGPAARNWNHYALVAEFERRQEQAIDTIRDHPGRYVIRVLRNYWYYSRFTGRNPLTANMGTMIASAPPAADIWMRLYEMLLVQELRSPAALQDRVYINPEPIRPWEVSGFFFTFPLIVFFSIRKTMRLWRAGRAEARMTAFMLYAVLWVLAMVLFVDGDEANRIRTSTMPYVVMLAFWVVPPHFIRKLRSIGRSGK